MLKAPFIANLKSNLRDKETKADKAGRMKIFVISRNEKQILGQEKC